MEKAKVSIHLFKVTLESDDTRSFESMIEQVARDKLEDRMKSVNFAQIRLDHIEDLPERNSLPRRWLLDFTRFRDTSGPGKGRRDTPIEDLDIGEDEYFGEETAALFLPDQGYLIVQYNHHGVRPGAMRTYMSQYLGNEVNVFDLRLVLDKDAEQRYKRKKFFTRLHVAVDLAHLTAADHEGGNALAKVVDAATEMNASHLDLTISVGHSRTRNLVGVKMALKALLGRDNTVRIAKVSGSETSDGQVEAIDLINEKLIHREEIAPGPGRRLALKDRRVALERAYGKWAERIKNG